jgi:hypothetical protein
LPGLSRTAHRRSGTEPRPRVPGTGFPHRPGSCTRRSSRSGERGERGIWRRGRSSAPARRQSSAARFLAETHDVYAISLSLSEEQKRIADYWAEGPGTATPPVIGTSSPSTSSAKPTGNGSDGKVVCRSQRGPGRRVHSLLGREVRVLVTPSGHGDPQADRPVVAPLHHDSAVPFARLGTLHDLGRCVERARRTLPRQSRRAHGIHVRSDNDAGLELGRHAGTVAVQAYSLAS